MRKRETNMRRQPTAYGRGGYYSGRASYPVPARGGYRVGKTPVHRHRTLVLNGSNTSSPITPVSDSASPANPACPSWISKTDRHLQLINTSIYQEQTEARVKAIEQTRLQKLQKKENEERARFLNHLQRSGSSSQVATTPNAAPTYEVLVNGVKFAVVRNGSKLVKLPGASNGFHDSNPGAHAHQPCPYSEDLNGPKATPHIAYVGGVKFYRTKNGNMYRQAVIQAQRYVALPSDAQLLTIMVIGVPEASKSSVSHAGRFQPPVPFFESQFHSYLQLLCCSRAARPPPMSLCPRYIVFRIG